MSETTHLWEALAELGFGLVLWLSDQAYNCWQPSRICAFKNHPQTLHVMIQIFLVNC